MAKLSSFTANTRAISDGEWVEVNPTDPFKIKTRGFTARYRDLLNRLRRQASREANRGLQPGAIPHSPEALPPTMEDRCQAQALAEECFLDVQGLTGEDGSAVTAEQFREMLQDPETYGALLVLTIGAAARIQSERQQDAEAAAKN